MLLSVLLRGPNVAEEQSPLAGFVGSHGGRVPKRGSFSCRTLQGSFAAVLLKAACGRPTQRERARDEEVDEEALSAALQGRAERTDEECLEEREARENKQWKEDPLGSD